jgi:MFS transporter, ACS family, tartrate transporter
MIYFLVVAAVGLLSAMPVFWAFPTGLFSGTAAAGIAVVAAIGNLGGFVGPAFTGIAEDSTGEFEMPLTVLAVLLLAAATLVVLVRGRPAAAVAEPAQPAVEATSG